MNETRLFCTDEHLLHTIYIACDSFELICAKYHGNTIIKQGNTRINYISKNFMGEF